MATKTKKSSKSKAKPKSATAATPMGLSSSPMGLSNAPCTHPCTNVVRFFEDRDVPANTGIGSVLTNIDGYSYINIYVKFNQKTANEAPVNLGVMFSLDAAGTMKARRYVNLEANLPAQQNTNFIQVSGAGAWHGSPHNISAYIVRLPVMGPFVQVFAENFTPLARKVSIWAYLVA